MPIILCETFPCAPDDYRPVKEIKRVGMRAAANYMIGFPDETEEEINQTIEFAKKNMTKTSI